MMMMPPLPLSQKRIRCPSACQWDPMDFQAPGRSFNSFVCSRTSFAFRIFSTRLDSPAPLVWFQLVAQMSLRLEPPVKRRSSTASSPIHLVGLSAGNVWREIVHFLFSCLVWSLGPLFFVAVDKCWWFGSEAADRLEAIILMISWFIYSRHLSSFLASGISPRLSLEPMSFPLKRYHCWLWHFQILFIPRKSYCWYIFIVPTRNRLGPDSVKLQH